MERRRHASSGAPTGFLDFSSSSSSSSWQRAGSLHTAPPNTSPRQLASHTPAPTAPLPESSTSFSRRVPPTPSPLRNMPPLAAAATEYMLCGDGSIGREIHRGKDHKCSVRIRGDLFVKYRLRTVGGPVVSRPLHGEPPRRFDRTFDLFDPDTFFRSYTACRDAIHQMLEQTPPLCELDLAADNWEDFLPHNLATLNLAVSRRLVEKHGGAPLRFSLDMSLNIWVTASPRRCSSRASRPARRQHPHAAGSRRRRCCLRSVVYVWRNWRLETLAPTPSGCLALTPSTMGASSRGSTRWPHARCVAAICAGTLLLPPTHQWAGFQVSDSDRRHNTCVARFPIDYSWKVFINFALFLKA